MDRSELWRLSVVMPCYNEQDYVKQAMVDVLRGFDEFGIDGELVLVNDGSTDASGSIANTVAKDDKRVRVLNKENRSGVGIGFWDGLRMASKDWAVMMPADGENTAAEVFHYRHLVRDVDIVIPFVHNRDVRSLKRRFISAIYRLVINLSFGTVLNYTNGTVIYNRHALMTVDLRSTGFFYQTELLVKLVRRGFLYAEVPHYISSREGGVSKALTLRSFVDIVNSIIRLLWDIHISRIEGHRVLMSELPHETITRKRYDAFIKKNA